MDPASFVAEGCFSQEQRNLMALVEIIEIHGTLPSRKREHELSLSLVGLQKEQIHVMRLSYHKHLEIPIGYLFVPILQLLPNRRIYQSLLVAN